MTKEPVTMAESIDWLFTRLAGTYGAQWTRLWDGSPITDVKSAWGYELSGYAGNPSAIRYALENLPERCPNVIQFRNLCRAAPTVQPQRIDGPKADPERVAAELAKLAEIPARPKNDMREWARRIIGREKQGDNVSRYSLHCARSALGVVFGREAV